MEDLLIPQQVRNKLPEEVRKFVFFFVYFLSVILVLCVVLGVFCLGGVMACYEPLDSILKRLESKLQDFHSKFSFFDF